MKVLIFLLKTCSDELQEINAFCLCPSCEELNLEYESSNLQYMDYVDHPMIWCDGCSGRMILNLTIDDIYNMKSSCLEIKNLPFKLSLKELKKNYNLNKIEKEINNFWDVPYDFNSVDYPDQKPITIKDFNFYNIDLLFIKKVINNDLIDYCSNYDITQDQIYELIQNNYSKEIIDKYNIYKKKYNNYHDNNISELFKKPHLWLECNSYNTENPEKEYPKNFHLDHDGVYVYTECIDSKGNIIYSKYCGD